MNIVSFQSSYDLAAVSSGIVHIGLGAFHRAHQAVYIERYLQAHNGGEWGIVSANIRSNVALVEQLNAAHNFYHVVENTDRDNVAVREVRAITKAIFAGQDRTELLAQLCQTDTKIVTLTVTEKGYGIEPASGQLNQQDKAVAADLKDLQGAQSVPGLLLTALQSRRAKGLSGFTILSCDNMPHNGKRVKGAVMQMATARDPELANWIEQNVSFPSSMVDRIVPAMTDETLAKLNAKFGFNDPNVIETEQFSQWVVEDKFCQGRPALEEVGVEFVDDVQAYETMKLRLLNGSHSLLAYCGQLLGLNTVDQAISHPTLRAMVEAFMIETKNSVAVKIDIDAYCQSLIARFSNETLNHRLAQIATDGSQKIPQRWLAHIEENRAASNVLSTTEMALAAWMIYMGGKRRDGMDLPINDPLQKTFAHCLKVESAEQSVRNYLSVESVFPSSWQQDDALIARLASNVDRLLNARSLAAVDAVFT